MQPNDKWAPVPKHNRRAFVFQKANRYRKTREELFASVAKAFLLLLRVGHPASWHGGAMFMSGRRIDAVQVASHAFDAARGSLSLNVFPTDTS